MPNEGTYWTSQMTFIRLPHDRNWTLEIRTYDGDEGRTIARSHGIGLLDEHVLGENIDVWEAVTEGLAIRMEGLSRKFPNG